MPQKQRQQEWFVTERARALARVHLTRRPDLVVTEAQPGLKFDYLVFLSPDMDKPAVCQFGVALRAEVRAATVEQANRRLRPVMQSFHRAGEFPYPVCLFYFTMEDDRGYYTWIAEPLLSDDGKPKLESHATADCKVLDRKALDTIVDRVKHWYDALFVAMAV